LNEIEYFDQTFVATFRDYLFERMNRRKTDITLSRLPEMGPVMIEVPVIHAVLYCVLSPFINKESKYNRLRSFGYSSKYLCRILDLYSINYPKDKIYEKIDIYSTFSWMMKEAHENKKQFKNKIRSQYQNYTIVDSKIIPLDGPVVNKYELPSFTKSLTLKQILGMYNLVDTQTKAIEIDLEDIDDIEVYREVPIPEPVYNYCYRTYEYVAIEINPNTCRPYEIDRKTGNDWEIQAVKTFGPLNKQIHLNNYFGLYVSQYFEYPKKEQFIDYLYNQEKNKKENSKDTLPAFINEYIDDLFIDYKFIMENITPLQFELKWTVKCSY
jgi:hypothetical protein